MAKILAAPGWLKRTIENNPRGPMETFLAQVRHMVLARTNNDQSPYSLEVSIEELDDDLLQTASETATAQL